MAWSPPACQRRSWLVEQAGDYATQISHHTRDGTECAAMDEDRFNMSVRKFLKVVGVTSQREIEKAVHEAVQAGRLRGNEQLQAKVTLTIEDIGLAHVVEDRIELG
jgi:hypothetical protein